MADIKQIKVGSTTYDIHAINSDDSSKLGGQDSTYYLNYNNLTNKPTIPTDTNQKIKAGNVTFGNNDVVDIVAGSNTTVTGLASGTGAPKITISATDTGATSIETTGSGNAVSSASYDSSTRKITLSKGVTALTSHQSIKTLKTDNTTAQSTSSSEAIAGSGTINLHKVAKTGTYSDLIGKPTIPATNVIPTTTTANKVLVSTTTSGTAKWSDWSSAGFLKTNASGVISVDTNTYLTTSGTAANSSKLNNQEASYYLNYNNLTNKPTLPTFNSLNFISTISSGNTSTYKWHRLMHINTMARYADCESTFYYTARFQNGYHCIFRVEFRTNNTSVPPSPSIIILSGNMPASDMVITMNYTKRSSDNVYEAYCDVFVKVGQWARAQLYRIGETTSDRIVFYNSSEGENASSHVEAYTEINGSTAGCASYDLYQKSAYDNTGSTTIQSYPASDVSSWAKASTKPSYTASEVGALASNGTAVNSSKLNNQEASYYLNYNNLSNKPTIPSVSNATITIKQTGISDQTFTLNGSATTITLVDTNTWRPVGTGATDAAAGNHAHGNITNTGTITSTAVTSATGFLVYDSNNKIQRATSANARTILGAGTYSKPSGGIPASDLAESYYLASNPNGYTSVTESTVSGWGFTKNAGTVTSVDSTLPLNGNVVLNAVSYVAQTLTNAQKTQARTNIGAGTSNFTGYTSSNKLSTDYINNVAGWTSNAGTVIGSGLTADTFVVGNGTVNVKTSTMKPTTSSTTWSTTSDVNVPTMKAISSYVTGLGYTKNTGTVTSVGAGTGLSISGTASVNPTVNIASGYKLPSTTEWNGKVDGPSSVTANSIPKFSGTTGKLIAESTLTITDGNASSKTYLGTSGNGLQISSNGGNISLIPGSNGAVVEETTFRPFVNATPYMSLGSSTYPWYNAYITSGVTIGTSDTAAGGSLSIVNNYGVAILSKVSGSVATQLSHAGPTTYTLTFPTTTGTLALTSQLPSASYSSGLQISTGRNLYVPYATADQYGVVKPAAVRSSAITTTTGGTASNRYYGVEKDSNGKLFVNVPWSSSSEWNPDWGYTLKYYQGATFGKCYYINCPGDYAFGCGESGFFIDTDPVGLADQTKNMVLISKAENYAIFNLAYIQGIGIWNSDEGQSYDEFSAIDFKDIAQKGTVVAHGTCTTSAGTQVKTVTVAGLKVRNGTWFILELTNANTYSSKPLYLNVNGTGDKKIYINNKVTSASYYAMPAGQYLVNIVINSSEDYCYCYPLNLVTTRLTSNISSSSTIGTQYHNFNKIVTIYGTESSQNGTIRIQDASSGGTTIAQATGEQGYWGKQDLCVTAFIPAGYDPYIYLNKMSTVYYRLAVVL